MDIPRLFAAVQAERDHESIMCTQYCAQGLWDLAAERARKVELLNAKLDALIEGRAHELYGSPPGT
jgi:hypothetical protein